MYFELFPDAPEQLGLVLLAIWVAELAEVAIDGSGSIYFTEFTLKLGEAKTDLNQMQAAEESEGTFEKLSCAHDAKILCCLGQMEVENFEFVFLICQVFQCSVIYLHGMVGQTVLFLKLGVHNVKCLSLSLDLPFLRSDSCPISSPCIRQASQALREQLAYTLDLLILKP